jgi:hypothetical protein
VHVSPIWLVVLTGCGRLGFETSSSVRPDAAGDAAVVRRPCGAALTAPDPVTISGTTFEFTSFTNNRRALPDTDVEILDAAGTPIASMRSDVTGAYSLPISTGGVAPTISIRYSRGGYFTSRFYYDAPLDRDLVIGDAMVLNPSDGPIWNVGAMDSVYSSAGIPRNAAAGTLNINFLDCANQSLGGVALALSAQAEVGSFLGGSTGMPDRTLTESETPLAFFVGYNAPAVSTTITATAPGLEFAPQTLNVASGNEVTLMVVRPLEP